MASFGSEKIDREQKREPYDCATPIVDLYEKCGIK